MNLRRRREPIVMTGPSGPTPRPTSLGAVIGVCGLIGYALAQASLAAPRPEQLASMVGAAASAPTNPTAPPETRDEAGAEGEDPREPGAEQESANDAESTSGSDDPEVEEAIPPADELDEPDEPDELDEPDEPGEASEDAPLGGSELTFRRGRVAYLQCLEAECRRDFSLERSVARVLESAASCIGTPGTGDVRVRVRAGTVDDVRFRETGDAPFEASLLHRCIDRRARAISGSDLPDGAVVSIRFELR